jgi:phage tail sheath protein FI
MATQLSPGINISEIDLTSSTAAVSTSIGGTVGNFSWGPVDQITVIDNQETLKRIFGKPDDTNYLSWFSASNFLDYSTTLLTARVVASDALNATSAGSGFLIKNDENYEFVRSAGAGEGPWAARFAGELGNSIKVSICPASSSDFGTWEYKDLFDTFPSSSPYASNRGASNDELHIVVVDVDGKLSGTSGAVLEKYAFVSAAKGAKKEDGTNNYYPDVVTRSSRYIHWLSHPSDFTDWGQEAANNINFIEAPTTNSTLATVAATLNGGAQGTAVADAELTAGWDLFKSKEEITVSLLISGAASTTVGQAVAALASNRKDCVAFLSPQYADVVNNPDSEAADVVTTRNTLNVNSSYAVMDSGWKYQYDKFADAYRWMPLNPDIAGLCARTDSNRAPWFSPAGETRGRIQNVVKLAFNPDKTERDTLYKNGVNPVLNIPGTGPILFGDKTMLAKPSAFDRINVRRLFIVIQQTIESAARNALFELNDAFTRGQFLALVEPYLSRVQAQRGVTDFKVVCDDTNNTAEVVNNNQFVGDIYVKPSRSINFIQLNFVAVRDGVEFSEIVGQF